MEKGGEIWYYIYDGHGSTRLLTNEAGRITDRYTYDACGNLLKKEGDTENDFLYTGEQYNANTGLYYLRARYMDPSTGTFISMDSYQGSLYDPVSLHKYLYANANPVMYTDPSGYMSFVVGMFANSEMAEAKAKHDAAILAIGFTLIYNLLKSKASVLARYNYAYAVNELISNIDLVEDIDVVTEKVKSKVVAIEKEITKKQCIYTVYTLVDSNGVVRYVGRTKNYSERMKQHNKKGGVMQKYGLEPGKIKKDNLTYEQARGIEQTWMLYYHTRNWFGEGGYNKINGISQNNGNKEEYYKSTISYFENQQDNEYLNILEDMGSWWIK